MKTQKHVLFLCSWYPNRLKPTNGNFIQKHAECIAIHNKVSVLHIQSSEHIQKYEIEEFSKGNLSETIVYFKKSNSLFSHAFRYYKAFRKGKKKILAKNGKYDITHVNHIYWLGLFAYFNRIFKNENYVISEHYSGFITNEINGIIKKLITKNILQKSSYILPVSEFLKSKLVTFEPNLIKYHIIGNVIDTSLFKPTLKNNTLSKKQFLHISNGENTSKNIFGILNVIKKLSNERNDFSLKIICDGDIKLIHEKARELNLLNSFVFIEPTCEPSQVSQHIQESIALVMFSNFETFGIVCLEAIACGIPIIATDIPAIQEYFSPEFGILVKPQEEEKLKNALNQVLENNYFSNKEELHNFVENRFSEKAISEKFQSIYTLVL